MILDPPWASGGSAPCGSHAIGAMTACRARCRMLAVAAIVNGPSPAAGKERFMSAPASARSMRCCRSPAFRSSRCACSCATSRRVRSRLLRWPPAASDLTVITSRPTGQLDRVARMGRERRQRGADHRAHQHIARAVHAEVDARVGDEGGENPHRRGGRRRDVADAGLTRRRRRRPSVRKGATARSASAPGVQPGLLARAGRGAAGVRTT